MPYTNAQKKIMLNLARKTLENYFGLTKNIEKGDLPKFLKEKRGCFVTLTKNDQLRGCMGYIEPVASLGSAISDNAINAAINDPRFAKLNKSELEEIKIEISVLTVPKKLKYTAISDMISKIKPHIHGIILKKGGYSATFLPQVWDEVPKKEQFLSYLSIKAGLNKDAWKKNPEIYTYEAEHFLEE